MHRAPLCLLLAAPLRSVSRGVSLMTLFGQQLSLIELTAIILLLFVVYLWMRSDRKRSQIAFQAEISVLRAELAEVKQYAVSEKEKYRQETETMTRQLMEAYRRIVELEANEKKLNERIAQLEQQVSNSPAGWMRVLGIWPDPSGLQLHEERDAIADAGFSYEGLWGEKATREEILRQLRIDRFTVLEIGAHGIEGKIHLADGDLVGPEFWAGALERSTIHIALLFACDSDGALSDVFRRRGVAHTISCVGEVADNAILRFARVFYQAYADKRDAKIAFRDARLVMGTLDRDKFVMR